MASMFDGIAFASAHHFVDLYLNNNYLGVYLFCDQIQVGEGRVDIDKDISIDGNNGYLIEKDFRASEEGVENKDYFVLNNEQTYAIKSPDTNSEEFIDNKDTQINYIRTYMLNCMNTILDTGNCSWADVTDLIDADSFADSYIIDEMFLNVDVFASSCYFYKPKDGKLFKGPNWDYDLGAGNCNYEVGNEDECPFDGGLYANRSWYGYLLKRQEFTEIVKSKLIAYRSVIDFLCEKLDATRPNSIYQEYQNAIERNFIKWDILGKYVSPQPKSVYEIDTVVGQLDYLRTWLIGRYTYIYKKYFNQELPCSIPVFLLNI